MHLCFVAKSRDEVDAFHQAGIDAGFTSNGSPGLRDYGRIDVRLAHDDAIYIVEANPNPYLAEGEDLAWAAEEGGHLYPDFIEKIAEMAISRHASRG